MTVAIEQRRQAVATPLITPTRLHYVSLVVAFGWLLVCARGQWFFFDEWDFLKLSSTDFLTPHLGHWSTVPMLFTALLRQTVGLGSYWPYIVPTLLIHLGIAHALWRLMLRVRVSPWIATSLALVVALFGAGAENVLWAFQFGFLGAVLLGIVAVLLVDRMSRESFRRHFLGVAALTVASLLFSGTALPLLVAVGIVALRRVGWWRAGLLLVPAVGVYGSWYVFAKLNPIYFFPPGMQIDSASRVLLDVPAFARRMIVGGFEGLTPVPLLGVLLVLALAVYGVVFARRLWRRSPAALGLAAAAVAFALVTAASRIDFSADTSSSSRYIYLTTLLLIPLVALLATWLSGSRRWREITIVAAVLLTAIYGAFVMREAGQEQTRTEQSTRDIVYATVGLIDDPPRDLNLSAHPDPAFAPSLTGFDIQALVDSGALKPAPYSPYAYDIALDRLSAPADAPVESSVLSSETKERP